MEEKQEMRNKYYKADSAIIQGDVAIGKDSSVWHYAVIRADEDQVVIGSQTNIQDGAVLHEDHGFPLIIGDRVTIGHKAIVHGAKIGNDVLIGMGSIVMNGSQIGDGSIVGAGALVLENTVIPSGSIVVGSPARIIGQIRDEQKEQNARGALEYVKLAKQNLNSIECSQPYLCAV